MTLITYKIEIKPTKEQAYLIDRHIGVSRWAYNFFLEMNHQRYQDGYWYMGAYEFAKWFNNEYLLTNPDDLWIKDYYAKSTKQAFIDADTAMKRFFKDQSGYPKWRSYKRHQGSYYFVKNSSKQTIVSERHRIKLPKLGWVRFKEYGYLPTDFEHYVVKSGRIKEQAGRYYLTCLVEQPEQLHELLLGDPIGIDLGVKEFAVIDDGTIYRNRNKDRQVKQIRKRLRRTQRKLSRQYIAYKARKMKEGRSATDLNLAKTERKVQRLYQRLHNIQADYQNQIVANLVRTKPNWVSIEDLNVKGMIKNRHLAKIVNQQGFYNFRTKLINKCQQLGIAVHLVNRFEPTSKICHQCGYKKVDLSLSERIYRCPNCGNVTDRDINAALNIRDTDNFVLAY